MARGRGTKSGSSADLVVGLLIIFAIGWVITHIQLVLLFLVVVGVAVVGVCIIRRYSGKNSIHDEPNQAQSRNAIQAKPMRPRVAPTVSKLEIDATKRRNQNDKLDAQIGLIGEAYKAHANDVNQRQSATIKQTELKQQGRCATNPTQHTTISRKKKVDVLGVTVKAIPIAEPTAVAQNTHGLGKAELYPDAVAHQAHMTPEEVEAKLRHLEEKIRNPYP